MLHSDQSPPIPSLAFSEESALLVASELSEAFIWPKKEKESPFKIRRRTASTVGDITLRTSDPNFASPPVIALVGTRERMETWLKDSGPGSSCLWAQVEDFSLNSRKSVLSGQLRLSYRLRSEQSLSLPVLNGTLLELSPKGGWKRNTKKSVHEILHPQHSDSSSLRSKYMDGSPSDIGTPKSDNSPDLERKSIGVANKERAVSLVMPEKAYRQLLQMVSPGGVVREYQSLLRRAAENSNFLDVDFQLVDLHKWLRQHPFAVFWEDTDVVIMRREAESSKWTLLRFDFEGGLIRSTEGASVSTLEISFGNKSVSTIYASRKSWWGEPTAEDGKAKEKQLEEVRSKLQWKTWKSISNGQECTSVSPLTLILIDILGTLATVSAAEIESVKFLFNSDSCEGSTQGQENLVSGISAIQTIFTCRGRKGLSSKEQHALANLKSESKELRSEGICTLLELLLKIGDGATSNIGSKVLVSSKSPASHFNPDTSRSSSVVWLHSDQEDIESSFWEQLRKESKPGGAEVNSTTGRGATEVEVRNQKQRHVSVKHQFPGVACEVGLPRVGGQTDRALGAAEDNWCRFEELDAVHQNEEDETKHEVGVMQITEWVKNGFLEVLVGKLMTTRSRCVQKQDYKLKKTVQFSLELVQEACLKVLDLLPGEGTARMVSLILQSLNELSEIIAKLSCTVENLGEGEKDSEKTSSNGASKDGSLLFVNKSVQLNSCTHENKLQESFARALKFSKLLFAVISRSSLLAGSLALSGGLDLILDFYSCLLRRFPVNLRLGAKSVATKPCAEGTLPGEVLKSQAKVDLTWLTATHNTSCNLKQFIIGSDSDVGAGSLGDGTCNNYVERLLTLIPGSKSVVRIPDDSGLNSHGTLNSESMNTKIEVGTSETSVIVLPSCDKNFDLTRTLSTVTSLDGSTDVETPILPQQKQRRPYVPRLPLSSIQISSSKSGSATTCGFKTSAAPADSGNLAPNVHTGSSSHFDILRAVSDVKYELLKSMANMFGNCSLSFMRLKGYLHQKLQNEEDPQLVLRFLPDMIGGFLNTVPEQTNRRAKRILLQVVSTLDKSEVGVGMCSTESFYSSRGEDAQGGPCWSGPGPPAFSDECKRSVDVLLLEIGKRLTLMVCHLTEMLTKSEAYERDVTSNQTWIIAGGSVCCEPSLVTKTLYSGHLLSLWIDVGILLQFLVDFVLLWPEEGSACRVLKSCGKPVERIFSLLAKFSCQSDWNLAQILAMQHLFKLSTACMNNAAQGKSPGLQVWNDVDTFFWQLFIVNDSNWTCVKDFADWVLLKSCHGCVRTLVEGYQKALWKPLEIYYSMLGQKVNPLCTQDENSDSLRRGETLRKSILPFFRASILLMKKKFKCQGQSYQASPVLYMSRLVFLLDFLMNPIEGLLMTVIKAPVSCRQLNEVQRETVTSSVSNSINSRRAKDQSIVQCSTQPVLSANNQPLCTNDTRGLCRKCATTSFETTCFQNFTSSIKHECLCILADIFSLKAFEATEEQSNLCINPRTQNPFLFGNYVNPFLEIIFFFFLKCYSDRGESSEREVQLPWLMTPLWQCVFGRYRKSMNCVLQRHDPMNSAVGSPVYKTLLGSKDKDEFVGCSVRSHEDEATSVACIMYARVLLALAQNQTDDVTQGFQHIKVMDFLVQQISLEYEISQVATPRDIVQGGSATNTPVVSTSLQFLDYSDFEAKIRRAALIRREERSSSSELSTIREGESIRRKLCEKVDGDAQLEFHDLSKTSCLLGGKSSQVARSPSSSVMTSIPSPAILIREESRLDRTPLQSSKRTFRDQTLNTVHELVQKSCMRGTGCCLGFHSARDMRSTDFAKKQPNWILLDQPLLRFHQTQMNWRKGMNSSEDITRGLFPFRERSRNTLLNNQVLSERGTNSTLTLFQRGTGAGATFHRNCPGENKNERDLSYEIQIHALPVSAENKVVVQLSATAKVCSSATTIAAHDQLAPLGEKKGEGNHDSKSTAVKYTGRFFDLNEEVERELAEEESPHSGSQISEGTETIEVCELPKDSISQQHGLQLPVQQPTAVDPGKLKFTVENIPAQPKSTRRSESGTNRRYAARPTIPRLKLPKSVRKGGQDMKSDASADLDLLPSTTSTQESKGRLSSLLELQKEFAASDKDDKSWRLGSYETERLRRRLYRHAGLHVLLLELFVALMLNIQGTLEACYSDRFPMENPKLNAPFFLSHHLNHAANSYLLPCLSKRMKDFKPAAYRILKLTWRALFTPMLYRNRNRIAHGAFAQVYTATVRRQREERVVLKLIDVSKGPHDPCRFFDVFSEVEILERFVGEPRVCQILDYGVDAESFVLVLKHYKCSLRTWRERQYGSSNGEIRPSTAVQRQMFYKTLPLYLEVYSAVLQAVKVLEAENVVHYDLKCDNILLEPVDPSCPESVFWTPIWPPADASNPLPFRVCIADFGQSKASLYLGGECTVRNRGTEYVKSPEMLKLLSSQSQRGSDFNVRHAGETVGKAVDVWSLGCLLYELLTGEYLFYDDDWLRFFIRVTVPSEELIPEDKAAKVDNYGPVMDLLRFVFVRDPIQRPTLDDLTICVEQLQLKVLEQTEANKSKVVDLTSKGLMDVFPDEDIDSDSDSSSSDGQTLRPLDVCLHSEIQHQRRRTLRKCLMCLNRVICHCDCAQE